MFFFKIIATQLTFERTNYILKKEDLTGFRPVIVSSLCQNATPEPQIFN